MPRRGSRETQQFEPEDMKYSLEQFVCPATDDHGQSAHKSVRIQPSMERDFEVILASRKFPYQTTSDIVRHALVRHVEWLHKLEPNIPRGFYSATMTILEICRDDEMKTRMRKTLEELDTRIQAHIRENDMPNVLRLLGIAKNAINTLPESKWKATYLGDFNTRFASYLQAPATQIDMQDVESQADQRGAFNGGVDDGE